MLILRRSLEMGEDFYPDEPYGERSLSAYTDLGRQLAKHYGL
jgi:hypothetical protein